MWITLNITNRCNFTCPTCLRGARGEPLDLDIALVERLLPEMKRFGYTGASLTGGEPLLHPRFADMVALLAESGLPLGIVTNGYLYEHYLPVLAAHRKSIDFVAVSIDGATRETHEKNRTLPGSFDRAQEALQAFRDERLFVKAVLCLTRSNYGELAEYLDRYCREADIVNVLNTIPCRHNRHLVLRQNQLNLCRSILNEQLRQKSNIHIATSVGMRSGLHFCRNIGLEGLTVNFRGDAVFCCDTIYDGAALGSLYTHGFSSVLGRCADAQAKLMKARIRLIAGGQMTDEMNTCAFCNRYLKATIGRLR